MQMNTGNLLDIVYDIVYDKIVRINRSFSDDLTKDMMHDASESICHCATLSRLKAFYP